MFLIRADGNAKIGAGHIMRCLTIGTELAKQGVGKEILFLCADEQSAELVRRNDFQAFAFGTDYRDMESELPAWESLLKRRPPDGERGEKPVILADSYYVTERYLDSLRRFGLVALMDDCGARRYPVDAVINYNAPADSAAYRMLYEKSPAGNRVKLFIGSSFTPVRQQFLGKNYHIRKDVQSVLITTGGGDSENIAGKILETIYNNRTEYHLVAGQFNPHLQELKRLEESRANIHIHSNVTDMAGLMAACDLAVTAGGSTIYELAVLGVPFVCFSYAENQEALTEYIGSRKIAGFAGAYHRAPELTLERIHELVQKLTAQGSLRRRFSDNEKKMIDGCGALRLAQALQNLRQAQTVG